MIVTNNHAGGRKRGKYEDDEDEKYDGKYDDGFESGSDELEENSVDGFVAEYNEEQQIMVWVQRKYEPDPAKASSQRTASYF